MTAQEIIDSFKHERAKFRAMREQAVDLKFIDGDKPIAWDNLRAHMRAYLDKVDPKRQTITDEQLAAAFGAQE